MGSFPASTLASSAGPTPRSSLSVPMALAQPARRQTFRHVLAHETEASIFLVIAPRARSRLPLFYFRDLIECLNTPRAR